MKQLLILTGDVVSIANFTSNANAANSPIPKKIEIAINEAMNFDIKPAIGDALTYALMEDILPTDALNNLYSGCVYTYNYSFIASGQTFYSSTTYMHQGIKESCKYYAYGRYLSTSQIQTTQYGVVNKVATESQILTKNELIWQINGYNEKASIIMKDVLKYIERNPTLFTTYYNHNKRVKPGIRIIQIGR